jgi:glutamine---fructose-6-phosphate transaminase (isomerizing)
MIEALARVPVDVELASEFRNRDSIVGERTMCLAISQRARPPTRSLR